MSFYILQTEEDKELVVKKNIETIYNHINVIIPLGIQETVLNDIKIVHYVKNLPSYLILKTEELTLNEIKRITSLKDALGFMEETTSKGKRPSVVIDKEILRFTNNDVNQIFTNFSDSVFIIGGMYAGYKGIINCIKKEEAYVTVNIKNSPRTVVPLWHCAIEKR